MAIMNNELLLLTLDEYVEGHEEAKKALIVMLARSKVRAHQKYDRNMHEDYLLNPVKLLLIGGSGTGKTHLIESLQKIVHFPFVRIDATNLTPSGAGGGIKAEELQKMIAKEAMNAVLNYPFEYKSPEEALDRTVVFVDEIDKLGREFDSSGNWNRHVQSNFLTTFDNKAELAGVSFVFAGAFEDITRKKEDKKKNLGFTHQKEVEEKELLDSLVLKSGMLPEIVGRMTAIIQLDTFTVDDYYRILQTRIMPKKRMDLAAYHIFDTDIEEEHLRQIAEDACKSEQGVRYMHRAVDRLFLDVEFKADPNFRMLEEF